MHHGKEGVFPLAAFLISVPCRAIRKLDHAAGRDGLAQRATLFDLVLAEEDGLRTRPSLPRTSSRPPPLFAAAAHGMHLRGICEIAACACDLRFIELLVSQCDLVRLSLFRPSKCPESS